MSANQTPNSVRHNMGELPDFHPDTGVDRKVLKQLKKRFLHLNQTRLQRARLALGERQQLLVDLLPLLFHVNHPMLPGFNGSDTPKGVSFFEPDPQQLRLAKTLARSFNYRKDLHQRRPLIDSLFMMGSVGTIAHSDSSDLDIWVCHKPELGAEAQQTLQHKCDLISHWAAQQLAVEAHFFLMSPDSEGAVSVSPMNAESSGSAQYHLLLDEFYRSAIWLAGKTPLWWWVPAKYEHEYSHFTEQLLKKRFVRKQEVVDFGPITHIPPNEYLGAGIWQLYKGIDAPHKSLLKLLLLEAYALTPEAEPLALTLKRDVYRTEPDANTLDAYVQIYRCIENYMQRSDQQERLDIARHCFYFKVDKPLTRKPSQSHKSWQRLLLEQITADWQWDQAQLSHLDRRRLWKTPQVQKERDRLVAELSKSYRLLSGISRNALAEAAISSRELAILGRKLHAAYERKAGKIEHLNPGISHDLSEAYLGIEKTGETTAPWRLYKHLHPHFMPEEHSRVHLKSAGNLSELLIWAYRNGIMTRTSQLTIRQSGLLFSLREHELLQSIAQWLPTHTLTADHQAFMEPAVITGQLIIINLGELPYPELYEQGLEKISDHSDALNYSGYKDNLIKRIDVASINSWQEIIVRGFTDNPLAEALLYYLRQTPPSARSKPPHIVIRCLSPQLARVITRRAETLWSDIAACFYTGTRPANSRYIFNADEVYYVLQFHQDMPNLYTATDLPQLLDILSRAQHQWSPVVVDRHSLQKHPLAAISATLHNPGIYLFYERQTTCVIYTLVDSGGALWQTRLEPAPDNNYLHPLLHFIRAAQERLSTDSLTPYEPLMGEAQEVYRYRLTRSDNGSYYAVQQNSQPLSVQGAFIDITVIAEPRDREIVYQLYCEERRFSAEDGDVYLQVARYIYQHRRQDKHYHCYISNLDLTACADLIAPETGLRLIHYLQHKQAIEEKLNARLQALI